MLADKNYLQMSGLPFPSKASRLEMTCRTLQELTLRNVRIDGSWICSANPLNLLKMKNEFLLLHILFADGRLKWGYRKITSDMLTKGE